MRGEPAKCKRRLRCLYCNDDRIHNSAVCVLNLHRDTFTIQGLAASNQNGNAPYYGYEKEEGKEKDPNRVGILRPPTISARIAAQGSLFTIRRYPNKAITRGVTIIPIPWDARGAILRELDQLGINQGTLFPDMDGIAEYIKWTFSERKQ